MRLPAGSPRRPQRNLPSPTARDRRRTAPALRSRSSRVRRRPTGSRSGSIRARVPEARFSSAARADAACANPGIPRRGLKPTNTTTPWRRGIIDRSATSRVTAQAASTASRCTARQPFAEMSSAGATNCPPALLTSRSMRAEALERSIDERLDLLGLADVGGNGEARAAVGLDRGSDRCERLRASAADDDRGPGRANSSCGRSADPGASTRDERDLARVRVGVSTARCPGATDTDVRRAIAAVYGSRRQWAHVRGTSSLSGAGPCRRRTDEGIGPDALPLGCLDAQPLHDRGMHDDHLRTRNLYRARSSEPGITDRLLIEAVALSRKSERAAEVSRRVLAWSLGRQFAPPRHRCPRISRVLGSFGQHPARGVTGPGMGVGANERVQPRRSLAARSCTPWFPGPSVFLAGVPCRSRAGFRRSSWSRVSGAPARARSRRPSEPPAGAPRLVAPWQV